MISVARLIKEMPEDYEQACYETKAMQRKRGVTAPGDLMMLALFHLLNGCSLVEISAMAKLAKLGELSDVAFMKRFEQCNEWFKKILSETVTNGFTAYRKPEQMEKYRVIAVDASDVTEKGRSGRVYRLHYALDLYRMESLQYKITTQQTGETLRNFEVSANDLFIADRAYGTLSGIQHCLEYGGNFILRLRSNCFKITDGQGETVDLQERLKSARGGEVIDIKAYADGNEGKKISLRICARRKTSEDVARSNERLRRRGSKKQIVPQKETYAFNEYIVLVTALPEDILAEQVLETYRLRWQVEMYFKRLKSIMDFGELPKKRPGSVIAWLNGKLMVAVLMEKILGQSDFPPNQESGEEYLA